MLNWMQAWSTNVGYAPFVSFVYFVHICKFEVSHIANLNVFVRLVERPAVYQPRSQQFDLGQGELYRPNATLQTRQILH